MPSLADFRVSDPRDIKTCISDILDYKGNDVFDFDTQRFDHDDEDGQGCAVDDDVGSFGNPPFSHTEHH